MTKLRGFKKITSATGFHAGGSQVWQLTFAKAAYSAPDPSSDPDGIDAGSGDNAVSVTRGR